MVTLTLRILSCLMVYNMLSGITEAANSYVITIPNRISPGVPLGMTVNILQASGNVHISSKLMNTAGTVLSNVTQVFSTASDSGSLILPIPTQGLTYGGYIVEVTGSGGLVFQEQSHVRFHGDGAFALIQTDRVYYTLGEKVKLRVAALHPNLHPFKGSFDVRLSDSTNRDVSEWLGVSGNLGVWEEEFFINNGMKRGKWNIKVTVQEQTTIHQIIVREIVVPKFNLTIDTPVSFTSDEKVHLINVYARYSFGKPVYGTIHFQVISSADDHIIVDRTQNLNGSYTYYLQYPPPEDLIVVAQVGDSNTGTIVTSSVKIVYVPTASVKVDPQISFKPDKETFRPGLPFVTYMKLPSSSISNLHADCRITTIVVKSCTLTYPPYQYKVVQTLTQNITNLTVQNNQYVRLHMQLPEHSDSMLLQIYADHVISTSKRFVGGHSPSDNYLNVLPETPEIQVGGNLSFQVASSGNLTNGLIVQVVARGIQVYSHKYSASVKRISVPVSGSFYPKASVLVYNVLPTGEIISDEFHIDVTGNPIENQLSLRCTNCTSSVAPMSDVALNIRSTPNSKVFLLGVDNTINFVQTGYDISSRDILRNIDSFLDPIHGDVKRNGFKRSKLMFKRYNSNAHDARDVFRTTGMNVLTDARVYDYDMENKSRIVDLTDECSDIPPWARTTQVPMYPGQPNPGQPYPGQPYPGQPYPGRPNPYPGGTYPPALPTALAYGFVRKRFPKTWVWESVDIGKSGEATLVKSLPDTITTWTLTGFTIGDKNGFGIAETPIKIKSFMNFFIDVRIPSFVVANNSVVVKVSIYNYKPSTERVSVEVERNDDPSYWETQIKQIPPNQQESVVFSMSFKTVLNSTITVSAFDYRRHTPLDVVKKTIDVKAPGVQKEYNIPTLISISRTTNNFVKQVDLPDAPNIVHGSKEIYATVTGDILAPSIHGLEKLIRMPTGCGEQTMLSLAPDVFILKYLNSTNQLQQDVKKKAIEYMIGGKNHELTYQRADGSFSIWGDGDSSGSTWLTAFVLLSFREAQEFIHIDDLVLRRMINWLLSHQNSDGSFSELRRVYEYQMQGGSASNKVTLTAFVLLSLIGNENLASKMGSIQQAILSSRYYIEQHISSIRDIYSLAVSGYALKRAQSTRAQQVYDHLRRHAVVKDNTMYWETGRRTRAANVNWLPPNPRARPIDIETTAYALLYTVLNQDLDDAMMIVRWLTSQRNPDGGMSSTQDTVVSLRALSEFSTLMYRNLTSRSSYMHVSFNNDGYTSNAYVDYANKHLLQTVQLQGDPKKVQIIANGEGLAIVDVVVKYNVQAKMNNSVFDVIANVTSESFDAITIRVCVRRHNNDNNGMVITEVGLPSGFTADLNSIGSVTYLKHTESDIDKVYMYFDQISNSDVCFNIQADRTDRATQAQAVPIFVYDYYEPENQGMGEYKAGIRKNMKLCDMCKECRICQDVEIG